MRIGDNWVRALARLWEGKAQLEALHDPKAAAPLLRQAFELYGIMGDNDGQGRCLLALGQALGQLRNCPSMAWTVCACLVGRKLGA